MAYVVTNVRKKREAESGVSLAPPKQKSLDFLGFIRANRDFSKGYERKNKKNRLASQVVCKTSHMPSLSFLPWRAAREGRRRSCE